MSKKECKDQKCPIHGSLHTRGRSYNAKVVSAKMDNTAVVEMEYTRPLKKYKRYMQSTSRISTHNPPCINAKKGDEVTLMECRKLSKTVSSTIIGKQDAKPENKKTPEKKKTKKKTGKKKTREAVDG